MSPDSGNQIAESVDRSSVEDEPPAASHSANNSVSGSRDGGEKTAGDVQPVAFQFAQYDRKPEGYVGTAQCATCHADRHQSYLLTHHSRSLREVDLETEGHGKTLVHRLSKRSYDVLVKDGGLRHREWRHFSGTPNDRMPIGELPVCYVMGSGAFGRGYLLADGDYLLQSPVTWYAGSDDLGMAPGYDQVNHLGFTRVIAAECLFCHAGLMSQRDDNPNHLAIHELSIGCERCHGPGEAHSRLYQDIESGVFDATSKDIDPLIVNPARLDRRQAESICGQCHLHGDAVVHPPGREIWDFVAGEDLADTRLHYKHDKRGEFKDSFTGHFDQMWQSQCYLQSETLTCVLVTTLTRRSRLPILSTGVGSSATNAMQTISSAGCQFDQRREQADNNCVQCHMPSIESNVPHTSTTSHLIAVYDAGKPRGVHSAEAESLRRVQKSPAISDQLLTRADAVARALWAVDQARERDFQWLDAEGLDEDLNKLLLGDPADPCVHSLLARLNRLRADRTATTETPQDQKALDQTWDKVADHATKTLQLEKRPVSSREGALEALGNQQMYGGDLCRRGAELYRANSNPPQCSGLVQSGALLWKTPSVFRRRSELFARRSVWTAAMSLPINRSPFCTAPSIPQHPSSAPRSRSD